MHAALRQLATSAQGPLILRLLNNLNRLDPGRIEEIYNDPLRDDVCFEELVIRSGLADDREIAQIYSDHYLLPLFDPPDDAPSPVHASVAGLLPASFCRHHLIAPLSDDGQTLEVALFSPESLALAEEIKLRTDRQMRALFASRSVIQRLLADLYRENKDALFEPSEHHDPADHDLAVQVPTDQVPADHQQVDQGREVPASRGHTACLPTSSRVSNASHYIRSLLEEAFRASASDIHLEPLAKSCRARLRINGRLIEVQPPPLEMLPQVLSEIKRLGKIDLRDDRLPQDGSITVRRGKRHVNVKVSTCPTSFGEKVAMRLYHAPSVPLQLDALGLTPRQHLDLVSALGRSRGLILINGPTASGKGTTLYACLNHFNASERNICTIEDRIRMQLDGVCQLQTRPSDGLSQTTALRAMMRQDPDVVMVSQLTDAETADICIRGAMSDHLVLSTLASSDAIEGIQRLKVLGVDPTWLSDSLTLTVSQRLLRRLCSACKVARPLDTGVAKRLGIEPKTEIFVPRGCSECRQSGYDAIMPVFEVIPIGDDFRELIRQETSAGEMREESKSLGLELLRDRCVEKLVLGQTSLDEILRP